MNRAYYFFLILMLITCGKKEVISYKEYHQSHQINSERHIQLIKMDAEILDTLFSQDLAIITGKKKLKKSIQQAVIMDSWNHTAEFLKLACERHQVHSHQLIYNKHTSDAVIKIWTASSDLNIIENTEPFNILMELKYSEKHGKAITLITELKKSVAKAFEQMLKGAEEYNKLVFKEFE